MGQNNSLIILKHKISCIKLPNREPSLGMLSQRTKIECKTVLELFEISTFCFECKLNFKRFQDFVVILTHVVLLDRLVED